jgi:hypothetical protein
MRANVLIIFILLAVSGMLSDNQSAWARDVDYESGEVRVNVSAGEPTEIKFPGKVSGGFKRKNSSVAIEKKEDSLIVFAAENLPASGEALIVKLDDGRSYSLRVSRSDAGNPRDSYLSIKDERLSPLASSEEDDPIYKSKSYDYAPPSQVPGLLREMVLAAELGKKSISGYRASDSYKGQIVLDDGTLRATIERIFMGTNLWGYVISAENLLDEGQKLNPASFRIDGTRAVSMSNWELAPKPLTVEEQIARKDKTTVYIVTKARRGKS